MLTGKMVSGPLQVHENKALSKLRKVLDYYTEIQLVYPNELEIEVADMLRLKLKMREVRRELEQRRTA